MVLGLPHPFPELVTYCLNVHLKVIFDSLSWSSKWTTFNIFVHTNLSVMLYFKQQLLFNWPHNKQVGFNLLFYLADFQKGFKAHPGPFPSDRPSDGLSQESDCMDMYLPQPPRTFTAQSLSILLSLQH
jgi:hypothetical protein